MRYFFITALFLLSLATYIRNLVWHNELYLWQDAAAKSQKWRAFLNLGSSYSDAGSTDSAIAAYKKALEIEPGCAPVHYSLGMIYHNIGSKDLALKELKLTLDNINNYYPKKEAPIITETKTHYKLGLLYYEMGLADDAEKEFRLVLNLSPLYSDAYYNLGVIYMDRGLWDRAISELERAVSLFKEPDHVARTRNLLGTAYTRRGVIEEGIRNFQEVLKIDPGNTEARENLNVALKLHQLH